MISFRSFLLEAAPKTPKTGLDKPEVYDHARDKGISFNVLAKRVRSIENTATRAKAAVAHINGFEEHGRIPRGDGTHYRDISRRPSKGGSKPFHYDRWFRACGVKDEDLK